MVRSSFALSLLATASTALAAKPTLTGLKDGLKTGVVPGAYIVEFEEGAVRISRHHTTLTGR